MEQTAASKKVRLPRGLKNRNPLNIRSTGVKWLGEVGRDPQYFCIFADERYGYRAAFKILRSYQKLHGICRLDRIIERWAPAKDGNHTGNYIKRVCRELMCDRERVFNFFRPSEMEVHCQLVRAMALVECGDEWAARISMEQIRWGYDLACGYQTNINQEEEN